MRTFLGAADWVCYTPQWNYTGQPAASVPVGLDGDGLPTAVQLVAPPTTSPWAARHPPELG